MDFRVEGLKHVFDPDIVALDGVDLAIPGGRSIAIVGANGSGKTTLLRHLDGLLRPTSGRVIVDGEDAAGLSVAQLAARVGLAFQEPDRQIFSRTVRTEVAFGPRSLGRAQSDQERAVAIALEATGLADLADQNPYDLGLAGRKLLSIASVLAMETPIVVLDEPTTGLDAPGIERVVQAISGLTEARRTIVGVSHDMRFVARAFGRVVLMDAGRVALDGPPAEVFDEAAWPRLRQAGLEPPPEAVVGARLGLGPTPTEEALTDALQGRRP